MEKYTISSPELRDPKREWYCAEEVDAEIERLRAENKAIIKSMFDKMLSDHDFIQKITKNPPHNFDVVIEDGALKKNYHKEGQMIAMSDYCDLQWQIDSLRQENEVLKKQNQWRDDWENAVGFKNILLAENGDIRLYNNAAPEDWCNWMQAAGAKFKIIEP